MEKRFENKVALVTGAGSGIGKRTALQFAEEGAKVIVADLSIENGQETVRLIQEMKGEAVFVKTDVSKAADVEAMVETAVKSYGRLDCAVNCAGVPGSILVSTVDHVEEEWDKTIDINLKGVWLCLKYQIPQMLKQGGGTIVNLASVAGLVGSTIGVAYIASKHGVVGITKAAAYEYASKNIRINALCPGTVRTPMGDLTYIGREEMMKVRHPIGRVGTPEDIAEASLWLCSDASSFITGTALPIDGGFMAY